MKRLSIVIPVRSGGDPYVTLRSLSRQSWTDFQVIIAQDEMGNANWARNRGFRLVRTELVLFSDDDIQWTPEALEKMVATLDEHPEAAYVYGSYKMGERVQCNVYFDAQRLRRANYISTMSVVRTVRFPGFDEQICRLQDWDLWLTMLDQGDVGVYCEKQVFETAVRNGITYGGTVDYRTAERLVMEKHRCALPSTL